MIPFIRSMLEDNSGGISSIRVLLLAAFLVVGGVWVKVALSTNTLPDIPAGIQAILIALAGAKAAQRFGEKAES